MKDSFSQMKSSDGEILSPKQAAIFLTDSLRKNLNMAFPILRVYKYSDNSGLYYCVLTESRDFITDKDTLNHKIKAVMLKADNGKFSKVWEINDNITKNGNEESSIWFWTKYIEFKDYDNDSLTEPIIIYGTSAMNGYDDGRIKFLIYYKGQKIAIRHQNGVLDLERGTLVDKTFYDLPQTLQSAIKQKMDLMMKNNQAIFPHGWQNAMKNKMTSFSERKQ